MMTHNLRKVHNHQLAAEITNTSTDFSQLGPMVTATLGELGRGGIDQRPEAVAADAGYWNEQHMDEVVANQHIPVLVAPDKGTRATPKRWLSSARAAWMRSVLGSDHGHQRYRKRKQDRRAALRQHQTQQRRLPLSPTRQNQGAPGVAIADDDPQPHQDSPPPARRHGGLNRPPPGHSPPHHEHGHGAAPTAVALTSGRRHL